MARVRTKRRTNTRRKAAGKGSPAVVDPEKIRKQEEKKPDLSSDPDELVRRARRLLRGEPERKCGCGS